MGLFICFSKRGLERVLTFINFTLRKYHVSDSIVLTSLLVEHTEKHLIQLLVEYNAAVAGYARSIRIPAVVVKFLQVLSIGLKIAPFFKYTPKKQLAESIVVPIVKTRCAILVLVEPPGLGYVDHYPRLGLLAEG